MKTPYLPNEQYFLVRWTDLETSWRMLAAPEKQRQIDEILHTLQTLDKSGQEKAVFTMVAATAWLTDDGTNSLDG